MGWERQASETRGRRRGTRRLNRAAAGLLLVVLAGCGKGSAINPVQWWHEREGGVIAKQRPPPPNADAPYPNLGSVPPKPPMPDAAAHGRIFSGLEADRANAQYEAAVAPLPAPRRGTRPSLLGGPPGARDADAASATLAATSAPPARGSAAAPLGPLVVLGAPGAEVSGTAPSIPAAPPPPPRLAGVAIPPTKPTPPPVAPPPPAHALAKLSESAAEPVAVGFKPGSAVLPPGSEASLKQLANRRAGHPIEVLGFGDANDATPEVQAEAVDLALARARAIGAALTANGVPATAIRLEAKANGHGGAARLVD
jgi:outer membrane protein OmpA-like peptidoglycan-associated protein